MSINNDSMQEECCHILVSFIRKMQNRSCRIKVPQLRGMMLQDKKRHFHFHPELFIQLSGCTVFDFPEEKIQLLPGEICVMPLGMPHGESALPWNRRPFRNLVIMFSPSAISWHFATAGTAHQPSVERPTHLIQTSESIRMADYLTDAIEAFHSGSQHRTTTVHGLMLAFLSSIGDLLNAATEGSRTRESHKVTQCRHYILRHITDPRLNVMNLAKRLQCSADYLSNLFHTETGTTLIAFLQKTRVSQAKNLLETSSLNIKETGLAVGYTDICYFTRVFKRVTGQTPRDYRKNHLSAQTHLPRN